MELAVGGGDKYWVEARFAKQAPKASTELITWRRVWVQMLHMAGLDTAIKNRTKNSIFKARDEYKKHFIELRVIPPVEIDAKQVVGDDHVWDDLAVKMASRLGYANSPAAAKDPYGIGVIIGNWAAYDDVILRDQKVTLTKDIASQHVIIDVGEVNPWAYLVHGDDWKNHDWVEATYGKRRIFKTTSYKVDPSLCRPIAEIGSDLPIRKVEVDLSQYAPTKGKTKGRLDLKIKGIKALREGTSWPGTNLIAIFCKDAPKKSIRTTMIHEIGHHVGMVPNPDGTWPTESRGIDKPGDYYEGHGHNGPHCQKGVPMDLRGEDFMEIVGRDDDDEDLQRFKPKCVMFGSTDASTVEHFCDACRRALRRIDMTHGWPAKLDKLRGKTLPSVPTNDSNS